jgi:hypothetical protein
MGTDHRTAVLRMKRNGEDSPREAVLREIMHWAKTSGHLGCVEGRVGMSMLESIVRKTVMTTADHLLEDFAAVEAGRDAESALADAAAASGTVGHLRGLLAGLPGELKVAVLDPALPPWNGLGPMDTPPDAQADTWVIWATPANAPGAAWRPLGPADRDGRWLLIKWKERGAHRVAMARWEDGQWRDCHGRPYGTPHLVDLCMEMPAAVSDEDTGP